MIKRKNSPATFILVSMALLFASGSACRRHFPNEKRYELKGKVVAVEKDKQLVTIAHEDIRDYMPGMTMPFTLREEWAYEILVPGDQVTATLVVDGSRVWLEELVITKESTDTSYPKSADGVAEARRGDEVPDYGL